MGKIHSLPCEWENALGEPGKFSGDESFKVPQVQKYAAYADLQEGSPDTPLPGETSIRLSPAPALRYGEGPFCGQIRTVA